MRIRHWCALMILCGCMPAARGNDWIFDSGEYTRNKEGERVDQYEKKKVPKRIPYEQYFGPDGPHPYIPYAFYENMEGGPYFYGAPGMTFFPDYYGYGYGYGGFGLPTYEPYGPYGF